MKNTIKYHSRKEYGFDSHHYWAKEESEHCRICGMSLKEAVERGFTDKQVVDEGKGEK